MKLKSLLSISLVSICFTSEVFAAKGLVIKLDITDKAQGLINSKIRKRAGMQETKTRHHVTVGYINATLPDAQMDLLGRTITQQLEQAYFNSTNPISLIFDVDCAKQPFGNIIVLAPSNPKDLQNVNETVNTVTCNSGYVLNTLTQPGSYTPHITISVNKNGVDSQYLPGLNKEINDLKANNNGRLYFKLDKFSYTVIK